MSVAKWGLLRRSQSGGCYAGLPESLGFWFCIHKRFQNLMSSPPARRRPPPEIHAGFCPSSSMSGACHQVIINHPRSERSERSEKLERSETSERSKDTCIPLYHHNHRRAERSEKSERHETSERSEKSEVKQPHAPFLPPSPTRDPTCEPVPATRDPTCAPAPAPGDPCRILSVVIHVRCLPSGHHQSPPV